jgi:hypothetical protein
VIQTSANASPSSWSRIFIPHLPKFNEARCPRKRTAVDWIATLSIPMGLFRFISVKLNSMCK